MIKAVLFDLDGTLLDTSIDIYNALNYALTSYGFKSISIDEAIAYTGDGNRNLVLKSLDHNADDETFEKVFTLFKKTYFENTINNTYIYSGMLETLKELKEDGYKLAVVSNKMDFLTQKIIKHYFGDLFDFVTGGREDIKLKPNPDIIYYALDKLGVSNTEAVYVGDSYGDYKTSLNANIKSIIVTYGFRSRKFLSSKGAETLIDSPKELLKLIK